MAVPNSLVILRRQPVTQPHACQVRIDLSDGLFFLLPRNLCNSRDDLAGPVAIDRESQALAEEETVEIEPIGGLECAREQRGRDLTSNEILISLGQISGARNLRNVKGK